MKDCKNDGSPIKFISEPNTIIRTFCPEVIDFLVTFIAKSSVKRAITSYIYEKFRILTVGKRTTQN